MTICFLCYDLQERTTKVRLETMNAAGTSIASVEETSFEYDTGSIRIASVHKIDSTNDGTFETIRRTEYLTDHANPTGYSQVIMETETDANGNPIKRTVYTIGHDQISQTVYGPGIGGATWDSGTTHFFGTDGHGSVRVLYDTLAAVVTSAANVLQVFHYDAYGNLLNMAATSALTSYLYSGEAFDTRINLQYLRARWYDPRTGRFGSLDPFAGNMTDPQSLHKYLYSQSDPTNHIDPSGLFVSSVSVLAASSIRSALGNIQFDAGWTIADILQNKFSYWSFASVLLLPVFGILGVVGREFAEAFFKGPIGKRLVRLMEETASRLGGLVGKLQGEEEKILRLIQRRQIPTLLNRQFLLVGDDIIKDVFGLPGKRVDFLSVKQGGQLVLSEAKGTNLADSIDQLADVNSHLKTVHNIKVSQLEVFLNFEKHYVKATTIGYDGIRVVKGMLENENGRIFVDGLPIRVVWFS